MEATYMSVNRGMDKDVVGMYIYIYTMKYDSAITRNKIVHLQTWMALESVIQSEISHKEKKKYRILTHICEIYKNGTDEPICKAEPIYAKQT